MPEHLIVIAHCYDVLVNQIPLGLLLYAHIPTSLLALCFGLFLIAKKRTLTTTSFFTLCFLFALWCFLSLNAWSGFLGAENMMFAWSLVDLISLLFFFFSYRFLHAYIFDADISTLEIIAGVLFILPVAVTTFFGYNLIGYESYYCEAVEHDLVTDYPYIAQAFMLLGILTIGVRGFLHSAKRSRRHEILLATLGVFLFLLFFFTAGFIVNLLVNYTAIENPYNYEIYGLFGMPILLAFLGYLIVRYQAFNVKLIGAQALMLGILALIGAEFFFVTSTSNKILVTVTLILACISGYFLVRSVQREVAARERNEQLAKDLAGANARLRELDRQKSEFVSIASHQLRSPLTAIRGYASMLLEGSYGAVPEKATAILERIQESSGYMATSIEDFLNVSRIEQGRMKYELAKIDVLLMTQKVVEELGSFAKKQEVTLSFSTANLKEAFAMVDPGKMRQVIYNLIDNSLKYTPKGTVVVTVSQDTSAKIISIAIKDTGVGMSAETQGAIFDKFIRAKNANSVNVSGTGLGLYVAKQMIEAMRGRINAVSEGEGKGSTFTITVPQAS